VSFLGDQLGGVVGRELIEEEEICSRDGVAQQLDALANERGDGAELFRGGMKAGLVEEGLQLAAEVLDEHGADVLGVEPDGFRIKGIFIREVDDGVGAVDSFESEGGGEFVESEELAV